MVSGKPSRFLFGAAGFTDLAGTIACLGNGGDQGIHRCHAGAQVDAGYFRGQIDGGNDAGKLVQHLLNTPAACGTGHSNDLQLYRLRNDVKPGFLDGANQFFG